MESVGLILTENWRNCSQNHVGGSNLREICIWRDPRVVPQPRQTNTGCQPWDSLSSSAGASGLVTLSLLGSSLPGCLSPKISLSCSRQVNHSRAKSFSGQNVWEQGESWNCDHEHPMASHFPGEEITRTAPWRCEHQARQL